MTSRRPPRSSTRRAKAGSSSSDSTIVGASRRSRIVSKSGTGEIREPDSPASSTTAEHVRGRLRPRDDHRVHRALPEAPLRLDDGLDSVLRARRGTGQLLGVEADVELGHVEAEELDPPAEAGKPPVGDSLSPVRAQAAVDDVEVGLELLGPPVAVVSESPPDEGELAAIRLVAVLLADLLRVGGQLPLVPGDRVEELRRDSYQRRRQAERRRQLPHLGLVAAERQRPSPFQRLSNGLGAGVRVPVHVAADPRSEGERERRPGTACR